MAVGRIETYLHSDSTTKNKGGAIIKVVTDTDFAARTDTLIDFAQTAAKLAYATFAHTRAFFAGGSMWTHIVNQFPQIEQQRLEAEAELKEHVRVTDIAILTL